MSVVLVFKVDKNRNILEQLHGSFRSRSFFKTALLTLFNIFGINYSLSVVLPCFLLLLSSSSFPLIPSLSAFLLLLLAKSSRLLSLIFNPSLHIFKPFVLNNAHDIFMKYCTILCFRKLFSFSLIVAES